MTTGSKLTKIVYVESEFKKSDVWSSESIEDWQMSESEIRVYVSNLLSWHKETNSILSRTTVNYVLEHGKKK
jgi:hypothetical protein